MRFAQRSLSVRQLYLATAAAGIAGFLFFAIRAGWRDALAFLLGAAISLANLWFFEWLARTIQPGETVKKPWEAGAFVTRYLIFFAAGYAIVKTLGVSPLPVVLGLFASTAAVLICSLGEFVSSLRRPKRT